MTDDETRRALSRLLAEEEADPAWAALREGRGDEETLRGDPQVAEPRLWQALRSEHEPVAPGQTEADTDLILRRLAHPAPRLVVTTTTVESARPLGAPFIENDNAQRAGAAVSPPVPLPKRRPARASALTGLLLAAGLLVFVGYRESRPLPEYTMAVQAVASEYRGDPPRGQTLTPGAEHRLELRPAHRAPRAVGARAFLRVGGAFVLPPQRLDAPSDGLLPLTLTTPPTLVAGPAELWVFIGPESALPTDAAAAQALAAAPPRGVRVQRSNVTVTPNVGAATP